MPISRYLFPSLVAAISLSAVMYSQAKPRIIKLDSLLEQLIWSLRVNRWNHPFPHVMDDWLSNSGDDFLADAQRWARIVETWQFLTPFFASRGYILYRKVPKNGELIPGPTPKPADPALQIYPHARRFSPDHPPRMSMPSALIWGARDRLGRDVVIKLVSEIDKPSNELLILQRLNKEPLRSHPRNHTIYVLEYLTFDNFVFVVMPRWDMSWEAGFSNVMELMEYTKVWLEVLDFLHEHRIAHQDLIAQNTGMNVFGSDDEIYQRKGLRNPGEVRYALYDFGHSLLFPEDADLSSTKITRFINFRHTECPKGPFNPFKADVAMLGDTLEARVRHIESIVPEIGHLFEEMKDENEETRLSANQALVKFSKIYGSLALWQLQAEVTIRSRWKPSR